MGTATKLGIGAAVLITGLYLFSKSNAGKKLNVVFRGIGFKKSGGILPTIVANVALQNPTNTPLTFNSIVGNLYINDKFLGDVSQFGKSTVLPNSEQLYSLNLRAGAAGVVQTVYSLWLNRKSLKVVARFDANVNVDGFIIPINETVNVV